MSPPCLETRTLPGLARSRTGHGGKLRPDAARKARDFQQSELKFIGEKHCFTSLTNF
jgi:hypothetical protein